MWKQSPSVRSRCWNASLLRTRHDLSAITLHAWIELQDLPFYITLTAFQKLQRLCMHTECFPRHCNLFVYYRDEKILISVLNSVLAFTQETWPMRNRTHRALGSIACSAVTLHTTCNGGNVFKSFLFEETCG